MTGLNFSSILDRREAFHSASGSVSDGRGTEEVRVLSGGVGNEIPASIDGVNRIISDRWLGGELFGWGLGGSTRIGTTLESALADFRNEICAL